MKKEKIGMILLLLLGMFQISIVEAYEKHHLTIPEGEGFKISTNGRDYEKGQQVPFYCDVQKGYELVNFQIFTESGRELEHKPYNFEMPDEEVYMVVEVRKIDYEIHLELGEGVNLKVPSTANLKDIITLNYVVEEGYQLDSLKIFTEEKEEVKLENNSFEMPASSVWIQMSTQKRKYKIETETKENIKIKIPEYGEKGEIIMISYESTEEEMVTSIMVETKSGNIIRVVEDTFEMPPEDVIIKLETQKIEPEYQIHYEKKEGILFTSKAKGKEKERITIDYQLKEGYELKKLEIVTESNQKIKLEENSFEMPKENVRVIAVVEQKKEEKSYEINVNGEKGIKIEIPKYAKEEEEVSFSYQLEEGYILKRIKIEAKEKEISCKENKFIMPKEPVLITFQLEKKEEKEKIEKFQVPNTKKEKRCFLYPFLLFPFLLKKEKKYKKISEFMLE